MELLLLGPIEARVDERPLALGGAQQRAVLAMLALEVNGAVTADRLIEGLWGERVPAGALKNVQVCVSRLRRALAGTDAEIVTRGRAYELRLGAERVDAARFERLAADPAHAREALALWRGPALADVADAPFAAAEIRRLDEQRLSAIELAIDADLAHGRHRDVIGELEALVAEHPLSERFHAQRMLALYRSGRQAEALEAYRHARAVLVEDIGVEPGAELRRLNDAVLQQDAALDAPVAEPPVAEPPVAEPPRGAVAPPATSDSRRLVTVLRCGAADAGELDPESLHGRLERAWDACALAVERHGGVVERSSAEGSVGVFGLAEAHEDDALRAARAALELRQADAQLRFGLDSGLVFAGRFTTGEAMTAAGALERAAAPGEILLSDSTQRLIERSALAEPHDGAWRLLGLRTGAAPAATPFVGRGAELVALRAAFDAARDEPGCRLLTLVGPAGIGKSRLTAELLAQVDATAAVGRCAAYGEGVTYRPIAEIVRQLGEPASAVEAAGRPEEMFLAVRRLLETAARERPLVVVVEDLHWAEPTLIDLLDYVAAFSAGLPILILATTRPELLERHPTWATPQAGRSLLALDALPDGEARRLVERLGAGEQAARIVRTAEGNPLFLEQLVAMQDEPALPASIHAVLAARIDRLEPAERTVLAYASVEGLAFHAGAVEGLVADAERPDVAGRLVGLVRKQLVRADPSALAGEDRFRFGHALIREAAYERLPKAVRAELHERLARWLESRPDAHDEVLGHHLEQAYRHGAELGKAVPALRREASERLAGAARSARGRGDARAAAGLLERAAALQDGAAILVELGTALFESGRLAEADAVLERAAAAAGEPLRARARVERQFVRLEAEASGALADAGLVADSAQRELARHGDERGQGRAWALRAWISWSQGQVGAADEAWRRAATHARRAGDERELFDILGWRASAAVFGPTPVGEAIERCARTREQVAGSPLAVALQLHPLGALHAMRGEFDAARRLLREADAILGELGRMESAVSHHEALVELLAGRPQAAEASLRAGYEALERMGDVPLLATTAAMLAQAAYAQDRLDEAAELSLRSEQGAPPEDLVTHVVWRGVRAKVLARSGSAADAEALAREGVALAAGTDLLNHHADALMDLAAVLQLGGRGDEADAAARGARGLYERKGNVVAAERTRRRTMEVS